MKKEEKTAYFVLLIVVVVSVAGLISSLSNQSVSAELIRGLRPSTVVINPGGGTAAPHRVGEAPQPLQHRMDIRKMSSEGAEDERLIGRYHRITIKPLRED